MKKILIAIDWYRPAHKAGGPITSIENLVNLLGDGSGLQFYIVCGCYDYGSKEPLDVVLNTWQTVGAAMVSYRDPKKLGMGTWKSIFQEVNPDVIHMQGLWSPRFSILPLLAAQRYKKAKIVVSPRGMLTAQSLGQKALVKKGVSLILKGLGAYRNIVFHSTNANETEEIGHFMGKRKQTILAMPNVPRNLGAGNGRDGKTPIKPKESGSIVWLFVGRISPEKNPLLLLEALAMVAVKSTGYFMGGYQDKQYFDDFQDALSKLPQNHTVTYLGEQDLREITVKLKEAHLLINTSISENFGHAMAESLSAGVPILVGPNTPWQGLWECGAGDVVAYEPAAYAQAITKFANMSEKAFSPFRKGAQNHFVKSCDLETTKTNYLNLYLEAKR